VKVKAIVIHLRRAVGRRPQVGRLQALLPFPVDVIDAVDGHALSGGAIRRVVAPQLHYPRYPFDLSPTEVACFLSHRKAWQQIVDEGLDAGLVAEDDAAIASPLFTDVVGVALDRLAPEEFVRFPHRERREQGAIVRRHGLGHVMEPSLPALGMVMQLVGREAARRLLQASQIFDRPVDSYVQMHWIHGARVLSARPIVVREIGGQLGGSVIHAPREGLFDKVVHEVQRPLLRLAVSIESTRHRRAA